MKFFMGTHMPHWLAELNVPLFVSHRRLFKRRTLPRARTGWALDSGGFTELSLNGKWTTKAADYVRSIRRYSDEIGKLSWAAPMDWMCEPVMLAKTGLTVLEHQRRTVDNFLRLRDLADDLPIVPVLQGWTRDDYLRCIDMYGSLGIDLSTYPTVGLGSVCRRQATSEIGDLVSTLAGLGLHLHGFGVKTSGIGRYGVHLVSSDSMAWSLRGRHISGCTSSHRTESNCQRWALTWRSRILVLADQSGLQLAHARALLDELERSSDPVVRARVVTALIELLDTVRHSAVHRAHVDGADWEVLSKALGIGRSAARRHYLDGGGVAEGA